MRGERERGGGGGGESMYSQQGILLLNGFSFKTSVHMVASLSFSHVCLHLSKIPS